MDTNIADHQYGLGELFSESWKYFSKNFVNILIVVLIIYVPINLILSIIPVAPVDSENFESSFRMYSNISRLLEGIFGIVVMGGITLMIGKSVRGEICDWKESLRFGFSKWGNLFLTNFLGGLIILGLTLCLIIPGVIWINYYIFSIPVVVLRNMRGKKALDYSKSLVKGRWWKIFGYMFAVGVVYAVLVLISTILFGLIPDIFLVSTISVTVIDLLYAFYIVFLVILFLNTEHQVYPPQPESAVVSSELGQVEPGSEGLPG